VILTAIGLIVVFYNYGTEIRAASIPHSYVGLAVTACVGLQVMAGCLRPGPDHKMRVFFNWGHRFLGQSTHILAAVTMFLAFDIEYFNNNMKWFGSAVLIVWVAIQLLWHIAFEILSCKGLPLGPSQKKNDSDKGDDRWDLRTTLFVIYAVTLAGLCTAALLAFLLF
jgi:heme A synthase